jgi:hypothetical protein
MIHRKMKKKCPIPICFEKPGSFILFPEFWRSTPRSHPYGRDGIIATVLNVENTQSTIGSVDSFPKDLLEKQSASQDAGVLEKRKDF